MIKPDVERLNANLNSYMTLNLLPELHRLSKAMAPLIITGYQGLPLLEIAKFLTKLKFCPQACGRCVSCETIDRESSVNLKVIRSDGKAIKVDQIREVIEFLSYKKDHTTVIIFENANNMNAQAANALLKTLEEPPDNCWILLTAPSIKTVLSTVRSRCLVYQAKPLDFSCFPDIEFKSDLQKNILQGRWDRLLGSEDMLMTVDEVHVWLKGASNSTNFELLDWMKGSKGLVELISYLRLILKNKLTRQKDTSSWIYMIDRLQDFELALGMNGDPKLIEDQLISSIKESHVFN